jgi:hypothetical protein
VLPTPGVPLKAAEPRDFASYLATCSAPASADHDWESDELSSSRHQRHYGKVGSSDGWGAGGAQPTEAPAFARTLASEAPPMNCVGPNGPIARFTSPQTCGSTMGAAVVAALALAAGTATANAAVTAARAVRDFRRVNIQ